MRGCCVFLRYYVLAVFVQPFKAHIDDLPIMLTGAKHLRPCCARCAPRARWASWGPSCDTCARLRRCRRGGATIAQLCISKAWPSSSREGCDRAAVCTLNSISLFLLSWLSLLVAEISCSPECAQKEGFAVESSSPSNCRRARCSVLLCTRRSDGELDLAAFERLIRHQASAQRAPAGAHAAMTHRR